MNGLTNGLPSGLRNGSALLRILMLALLVLGLFTIASVAAVPAPGTVENTVVSAIPSIVPNTDPPQHQLYIFVFRGIEADLRTDPQAPVRAQQYIDQAGKGVPREQILAAAASQISNLQNNGKTLTQISSIQDAPVAVYVYNSQGNAEALPSCSGPNFKTSTPLPPQNPGDPVNYYVLCNIDLNHYKGRCATFQAFYTGTDVESVVSSFPTEICDTRDLGPIESFTGRLGEMLSPTPQNYLALFAGFTLAGLLLATMYFSGKSPLTLLDIATPRLPAPKSIAPSGQILGGYGYTEMKGATGNKMKVVSALFRGEAVHLAASVAAASVAGPGRPDVVTRINNVANAIRGTSGADRLAHSGKEIGWNRDFFRSMALLAAKYNLPMEEVLRLGRHLYDQNYDHGLLSRTLNQIEEGARRAGSERDRLLSASLRDYYLSSVQYQHLEILTGHPSVREGGIVRSTPQYAVQWATGKTLGHFALLRPFVSGSWDSLARSWWIGGRFFRATGQEIHRRGIETAHIFNLVRTQGIAEVGRRLGRGETLVPAALTRRIPQMTIGGVAPIDEKAGYHYDTLNKEMKYDLMRHMLTRIFGHYGVNLEVSELELLASSWRHDLDLVNRSGIHAAMAREEFQRVEAEIRAILHSTDPPGTDASASLSRKVELISELASRYGVRAQQAEVENVLHNLHTLEADHTPGYIKMLELTAYLQELHMDQTTPDGHPRREFQTFAGRDIIPEGHNWEFMVVRSYLREHAEGFVLENTRRNYEGNFEDHLNATSLYWFNRFATLNPSHAPMEHGEHILPEFARDGIAPLGIPGQQFGAIEDAMLQRLRGHLTDLGQAELLRLYPQLHGRIDNATLEHLKGMLTAERWMEVEYGLSDSGKFKLHTKDGLPVTGPERRSSGSSPGIHWWEEAGELGPNPLWWKSDMKRYWEAYNTDPKKYVPGSDFALLEYTSKMFSRRYVSYYNADIERDMRANMASHMSPADRASFEHHYGVSLDRAPLETLGSVVGMDAAQRSQMYQLLYARKLATEEIREFANSLFALNTYGTANGTTRYYGKALTAISIAALRDAGMAEDHPDILWLRNLNLHSPDELRQLAERLRGDSSRMADGRSFAYQDLIARFMQKKITYDTISKAELPWIMTHEGGLMPCVKDTPLADVDRVYGYAAMKDHKGIWRRFDPDTARVFLQERIEGEASHVRQPYAPRLYGHTYDEYGRRVEGTTLSYVSRARYTPALARDEHGALMTDAHGRPRTLESWYNEIQYNKDRHAWEGFIETLGRWTHSAVDPEERYRRDRTFNAALWRYSNMTEDWQGFWQHSNIEMKPKKEVAPMPMTIARYWFDREPPRALSWMPGIGEAGAVGIAARNIGLEIGHSVSRVFQEAFRDLTKSSWSITAYSEYMREHSWRLAEAIKRGNIDHVLEGLPSKEKTELRRLYQDVSNAHFAYHQIWDYAIDRNPWATSTSYGSRQRWSSYFHYGPFKPYSESTTYGAVPELYNNIGSRFLRWPMGVARKLMTIPFSMFRSAQEHMMGGATKWDIRESSFKHWDHAPPRKWEAFKSLINPLAHTEGRKYILFGEPGYWNLSGDTVRRDLAGERLGRGLKVFSQDTSHLFTGLMSVARTGGANPGASAYTHDFFLHLYPKMAEYLAFRSPHAEYFKQDPYVMQQALKTHIKRNVAAEALGLEREHEQRGFSMGQNQNYGWFSPAFFLWHGGPVPLGRIAPKEFLTHYGARFFDWTRGRGTTHIAGEGMEAGGRPPDVHVPAPGAGGGAGGAGAPGGAGAGGGAAGGPGGGGGAGAAGGARGPPGRAARFFGSVIDGAQRGFKTLSPYHAFQRQANDAYASVCLVCQTPGYRAGSRMRGAGVCRKCHADLP